jgi:AraC-like DNA-binding protein
MKIFREISTLKETEVFVVLDAINSKFDQPLHNHAELEINLVTGISGIRTVGDSIQTYQDQDLVLMGSFLSHKWNGDVLLQPRGKDHRMLTIHFAPELFYPQLLQKTHFAKIKTLLQNSNRGMRFFGTTYIDILARMKALTLDQGMDSVLGFFKMLDVLACSSEFELLTSESFAPQTFQSESKRIQIAFAYIQENFANYLIKVSDVASLVNMGDSAFSHFFRKSTHRSFKQFLIEVRMSFACKLLLSSDQTIAEICFQSGFNNMTNFNRLFMKNRGVTPMGYRKGER